MKQTPSPSFLSIIPVTAAAVITLVVLPLIPGLIVGSVLSIALVFIGAGAGLSMIVRERQKVVEAFRSLQYDLEEAEKRVPTVSAPDGTSLKERRKYQRLEIENLQSPCFICTRKGAIRSVSGGFESFCQNEGKSFELSSSASTAAAMLHRRLIHPDAEIQSDQIALSTSGGRLLCQTIPTGTDEYLVLIADVSGNSTARSISAEESGVLCIKLSVDGRIQQVGSNVSRALGTSPAALQSQPLSEFIAPSDRGDFEAIVAEGEGTLPLTFDSGPEPISALGRVFKDNDTPNESRWLVAIQTSGVVNNDDTTDASVLGAFTGLPIAAFDESGRLTEASAAYRTLFGYGEGEIFGLPAKILYPDTVTEPRRSVGDATERCEIAPLPPGRTELGQTVQTKALFVPYTGRGSDTAFFVLELDAGFIPEARSQSQSQSLSAECDADNQQLAQHLERMIETLEAGNLSTATPSYENTPYGALLSRFNIILHGLMEEARSNGHALVTIRDSAIALHTALASHQSDTEQQLSVVDQSSSSLSRLSDGMKTTVDQTTAIEAEINATRATARQGGDVVKTAITAMGEIESSSSEISQIIVMIDDIAFQTNLLALNAGVEAARAGDAGRGFAVVASEVRALAQRSSDAAKQIKDLISKSTQEVASGVGLVGQTGEVLENIIEAINRINVQFQQLNESAGQQVQGLASAGQALSDLKASSKGVHERSAEHTHAIKRIADEVERIALLFTDKGVSTQRQSAPPLTLQTPSVVKSEPIRDPKRAQSVAPIVRQQQAEVQKVAAAISATQAVDDPFTDFDDDWTDF
ncbi:MAG: methyl-accepting chemotaxis protein [Pseudomonadota bacterium]